MKRLVAAMLCLAFGAPAFAETTGLRAFVTGDDSRGWEAVGRLNIAGVAFCTGSLISDTLVLTAAHCLFDADTGERYPDTSIEFLAGWRGGRADAYRSVRRAVIAPDYDFAGADKTARVASDLALLELSTPVRKSSVTPFEIGTWPRKGREVGVVSYAHDRAEAASIQETCKVLARQQGALVMDCDVDHGSSGAPVFAIENGTPRIVSVISAKAHVGDLAVSLGTGLGPTLDTLKAMLATSDGMFTSVRGTLPEVSGRTGGAAGSAKFMKPSGS